VLDFDMFETQVRVISEDNRECWVISEVVR
jgi:hypothetical protein